MEGLKITAACLEREELERIVTKLGNLGLIEIDVVDRKWIIVDELETMVKDLEHFTLAAASEAIGDKDWLSI